MPLLIRSPDSSVPGEGGRGFALAEVLVALAVAGFAAVATATLLHGSVAELRLARQEQRLLDAARTVVARTRADGFHLLPERFAAADTDLSAGLDTEDGTAPADWADLVAGLPDGRVRARLEGLGADGAAAPFRTAVALRITIDASCACGPRRSSSVRLVELRF